MQRYFIDQTLKSLDQQIGLGGDIYHHIIRVMRQGPGDQVLLVDPQGRVAQAQIDQVQGDTVSFDLVSWQEDQSELPFDVTIACGLSKNQKLDWIVQKGTELGMASLIPVALQRDVVKWPAKKRVQRQARLQKIAQEAAEQSHRSRIPDVQAWTSFADFLDLLESYDHLLVADEEVAGSHPLPQVLGEVEAGDSLLVLFGSEGGLDRQEIAALKGRGVQSCGLGPRILRAETAPLYFLSACSYQVEMEHSNEIK